MPVRFWPASLWTAGAGCRAACTGDRRAPRAGVEAVIVGRKPLDAELDLRLARYFRMSDGLFLSLQADYELLEAKRALNGDLDRIVPRAA